MSLTRFAISLLCGGLLLTGCHSSGSDDSPVVARVYDSELHQGDLQGLVPAGLAPEDSAVIVNNYVEQWIRQAVILEKAKRNVDNDFARELQEYRNNLLVYAYERQIVDQLLDTTVSEAQVEEYSV